MAGLCEGGNEPPGSLKASKPHIDVSLTCEHDPKLQEYCVCPQNMPQFDYEGIPNQAPDTNKPMILNGPTSRNREGSDQARYSLLYSGSYCSFVHSILVEVGYILCLSEFVKYKSKLSSQSTGKMYKSYQSTSRRSFAFVYYHSAGLPATCVQPLHGMGGVKALQFTARERCSTSLF
ncbi:hypothetical protein ANN_22148 [Periplaneta americana]|uniref:Uncharacterized protein n=1 Tax=Periplaneta americana TaxID=6978 RepID=A0ABQ8S7C2_PERAM|nr:hypothetical protein ANN_22148 [Periplaneta americana]